MERDHTLRLAEEFLGLGVVSVTGGFDQGTQAQKGGLGVLGLGEAGGGHGLDEELERLGLARLLSSSLGEGLEGELRVSTSKPGERERDQEIARSAWVVLDDAASGLDHSEGSLIAWHGSDWASDDGPCRFVEPTDALGAIGGDLERVPCDRGPEAGLLPKGG